MTEKEKAKELVHKFYDSMNPNAPDCNISYNQAKECALNSVNETLSIVNNAYYHNGYYHDANALVSYLEQVKQEIKNL
jgi:hypothetical protein